MTRFEQNHRKDMWNPMYAFGWLLACIELRFIKKRPPYLEGWEHKTTFKGIIESTATGFSAYIEGVPGLGVASATRDDIQRHLHEAFELHRLAYPVNPNCYTMFFVDAAQAHLWSA